MLVDIAPCERFQRCTAGGTRREEGKQSAHWYVTDTYTLLPTVVVRRVLSLGRSLPLAKWWGSAGPGRRNYSRTVLIYYVAWRGRETGGKWARVRFWHFVLSQWHDKREDVSLGVSLPAIPRVRPRPRVRARASECGSEAKRSLIACLGTAAGIHVTPSRVWKHADTRRNNSRDDTMRRPHRSALPFHSHTAKQTTVKRQLRVNAVNSVRPSAALPWRDVAAALDAPGQWPAAWALSGNVSPIIPRDFESRC